VESFLGAGEVVIEELSLHEVDQHVLGLFTHLLVLAELLLPHQVLQAVGDVVVQRFREFLLELLEDLEEGLRVEIDEGLEVGELPLEFEKETAEGQHVVVL